MTDINPAPAVLVQIGIGADGQPLYVYRDPSPAAPAAPLVQHPWGAYAVAGCGLLVALAMVGTIIVAIVIGFAIALAVLAVAMVALTICVVVLRSLVKDMRKR